MKDIHVRMMQEGIKNPDLIFLGSSHGAACSQIATLFMQIKHSEQYKSICAFTVGGIKVLSENAYDYLEESNVCVVNVINSYIESDSLVVDPVCLLDLVPGGVMSCTKNSIIINTSGLDKDNPEIENRVFVFVSSNSCKLPVLPVYGSKYRNLLQFIQKDMRRLHSSDKQRVFWKCLRLSP
jgi:hypothetical protein